MKKPITRKAQLFVDEYMIDMNASAACRRAGYKGRPDSIGPRLLGNAGVAEAIAVAMARRQIRTQVDADWLLKRLHREAMADMADIYDTAGNLLPIQEWPIEWRQGLVSGFETVHEREGSGDDARRMLVRKIKLADRTAILDKIGRHVGVQAFKDRIEAKLEITMTAEQSLAALNGPTHKT